jgi:hypothetical protein
MLLETFGAVLGAAMLSDNNSTPDLTYGYVPGFLPGTSTQSKVVSAGDAFAAQAQGLLGQSVESKFMAAPGWLVHRTAPDVRSAVVDVSVPREAINQVKRLDRIATQVARQYGLRLRSPYEPGNFRQLKQMIAKTRSPLLSVPWVFSLPDRYSGPGGFPHSGGLLGMRGPTSSFRFPMPRPWERAPVGWQQAVPARVSRYGTTITPRQIPPNPDAYDQMDEKAAAHFAKWAQERHGRMIMRGPWGGDPIREAGYGRSVVEVTGGPLSSAETKYLAYLKDKYRLAKWFTQKLEAPIDPQTGQPAGPDTLLVNFDRQ